MKKLILITGKLLSTSLWTDMDKICAVSWNDNTRIIENLTQE